jgi:transposase
MESKVKKKNRKFTEEFKAEAVILANKVGNSKAAKDLDLSESLVRAWKKKSELSKSPQSNSGTGSSSKIKSYEDLERDVRRLSKEIGYLKEINSVLKKSTAIFSMGQLEGIR